MLLIAIGAPLLLFAATESVRLGLEPGEVFTGFERWDMLYYAANAREVFENGNGLFYALPLSSSPDSPRVYTHLELVLMGWTWHFTPLSMPAVWQITGLVSGVAMFLALFPLVGCFFPREQLRWAYPVLALAGGGTALTALWTWLGPGELDLPQLERLRAFGLLPLVEDGTGGWLAHFSALRAGAVGPAWLPNVYQNALFTTQAFYHALAFATFAAAVRGRRGWALLGVFLTWWSHPFTGLEVAGIVGSWAALETALLRQRRMAGFAAGVAGISAVFVAYNLIVIPRLSPEHAYVIEAWRGDFLFRFRDAFAMWGLFLLGPLSLLHPRLRALRLGDPADRFLVAWMAFVGLLLLHDRLLPESIPSFQPLHYAHGYFFLPIAILTLRAAERLTRAWPPRRKLAAGLAVLPLLLVDNVFFTVEAANSALRPVITADEEKIVEALAAAPGRDLVVVPASRMVLQQFLPVVTSHTPYLVNPLQTPFHAEKKRALARALDGPRPAAALRSLGIRWVVPSPAWSRLLAGDVAAGRARVVLDAGDVRLIELLGPVERRPVGFESGPDTARSGPARSSSGPRRR